ncbi:ABC transporter permease [Dokdonella sp.]|uniref:ABC transporter permease n=1 Tax=Dokdonella sp. TaxID=2291710 RepID=UPI001B187E9A|nr:ABC transporter permease [Dokdonella sp.]MBO9663908.1 ABC transporter permease [Dokdonella sp.]
MNDFRIAIRQLLKTPGFTVVALLTLALGIGACAAMFGIVNAVLLKPLPLHEPQRLAWIENAYPEGGMSGRTSMVDNLLDWRRQSRSFEQLAAYNAFFGSNQYTLLGATGPQRIRAVQVTQNLLDVLGVRTALGRNFVAEEAASLDAPSAILGHRFWQQQFAADPAVIGRTVTINNRPVQVVGVLPASFDFDSVFAPGAGVDLLTPMPLTEETAKWNNTLFVIGRLAPGVTTAAAQTELDTINRRVQAEHPERGSFGAAVSGLEQHVRGPFRTAFLILFGAVVCVLLIACLNLSNLLLTRAQSRRKETAVRVALGANRLHVVRLALAESFVLALGGGLLGVALAAFATSGLVDLQAFDIPLLRSADIDSTALLFAFFVACASGALCGALPALQLWHSDVKSTLGEVGSSGNSGKQAARVRRTLVVAQIALTCVLLIGAGLLLRSFAEVMNVKLGFEPQQAVAWRLDATREFGTPEERASYYERLAERVRALPGVETAGLGDSLPLGRNRTWSAGAEGEVYSRHRYPTASPRLVDHRYLQAMRVPLLAGRYLDDRDSATAARAVVVNRTMARTLWPDRDPLGQKVMDGTEAGTDYGVVVGVVGDIPRGIEEAAYPEMYFDLRQNEDWGSLELVVRSSQPHASLVPAVRAALHDFDPQLASEDYVTLEEVVDRTVAPRRLTTSMLGGFSSFALLLAALGIYGVIAYSVAQRTREIAIRVAVGSRRSGVVRLIVGEGLRIGVFGIGLGLGLALLGARLLQSLLFGVSALDPGVFALNAAIVLGVALLASLVPALRAAATDPVSALR